MTIKYNKKEIFTTYLRDVQKKDLKDAGEREATIIRSYFFDPKNKDSKVNFDKSKLEDNTLGLMIEVETKYFGQSSIGIKDREDITSFLNKTGLSYDNLDSLTGRKVKEYSDLITTIGISI